MGNREADHIQYLQTQIENMNQESTQIDEDIITTTDQYKEYQNQIEVGFIVLRE
jgi:septal ring factor EnvC (AmiA/AmiB activator)